MTADQQFNFEGDDSFTTSACDKHEKLSPEIIIDPWTRMVLGVIVRTDLGEPKQQSLNTGNREVKDHGFIWGPHSPTEFTIDKSAEFLSNLLKESSRNFGDLDLA